MILYSLKKNYRPFLFNEGEYLPVYVKELLTENVDIERNTESNFIS